jgi:hypothetical protein
MCAAILDAFGSHKPRLIAIAARRGEHDRHAENAQRLATPQRALSSHRKRRIFPSQAQILDLNWSMFRFTFRASIQPMG